MHHCSRFSITILGASEMGGSFETSQAGHFETAKGLVEISGSPELAFSSGPNKVM
jgi:hypothetical protein